METRNLTIYRQTDRQTDRQTNRQTDSLGLLCDSIKYVENTSNKECLWQGKFTRRFLDKLNEYGKGRIWRDESIKDICKE